MSASAVIRAVVMAATTIAAMTRAAVFIRTGMTWSSATNAEEAAMSKTPKQLDAITDTVLAYRPKARSKPAVQRKRRKTILEKKRNVEKEK